MRVSPRRGLPGEAAPPREEEASPGGGGMRRPGAARARMRASLAASLAAVALAACGGGESGPDPLTVRAHPGGTVEVASASGAPVTVAAGGSVPFAAGEALTMTARPAAFHRFAGWALLPGGMLCGSGADANPCALAAGASSPGDSVAAAFEPRAFSVSWQGPGSVAADVGRAALVADPYAPGAFAGWPARPATARRRWSATSRRRPGTTPCRSPRSAPSSPASAPSSSA